MFFSTVGDRWVICDQCHGHSFSARFHKKTHTLLIGCYNINRGDVQRKNVVNNVDKSSLWAP